MRRPIQLRSERGGLNLVAGAVILVVVGSLVAIPYVFMGQKEAETARTGIDAIGKANDASAQLLLRNALVGAQTWYAEQGALTGYGAEQATAFDPQTPYDQQGAATAGRVSVRGVGPDTVVFVTRGGAGPLCAALNAGSVTYGKVDAASALQCSGTGW